ncbi:uncharacterized protein BDW43DRAFT_266866, partial [Aspergillus alliaceus]|uniref:uncharacterized protein n=1 Tax=Petromyces alliaceus TaxID=209559 RepID=UPI0012A4D6F6
MYGHVWYHHTGIKNTHHENRRVPYGVISNGVIRTVGYVYYIRPAKKKKKTSEGSSVLQYWMINGI